MKTKDFNYLLPNNLIAQTPSSQRDHSRLMILNRSDNSIKHQHFYNIVDYLDENDVLVINDTKVLPARIIGFKEQTKAKIEVLLLKEVLENCWECLVKPAKRIKVGDRVDFGEGQLILECISQGDMGIKTFRLFYNGILIEILNNIGTLPLPPYITTKEYANERYQTVYSNQSKSAAAPTAGLHFTEELLTQLKEKGIEIIRITLEVGLGTFRPVSTNKILDHQMHSETYHITKENSLLLNQAVLANKNIVAVGTTTVRTLESNYKNGRFTSKSSSTNIFIYPGYKFKIVDKILTNFHLPQSTLIMLVSAFYNTQQMIRAYEVAVKEKYRFFSFGDAMFIV